ncbi:protein of unknown function (plasmid) [Caballeronia sp. S22]
MVTRLKSTQHAAGSGPSRLSTRASLLV